jgi:hypothetical protein
MDTRSKLSAHDGTPFSDPSLYRSIAGALQYLTLTPHIANAVQQLCFFMHAPMFSRYQLIKLSTSLSQGHIALWPADLPFDNTRFGCYSDADWAGLS